MFFFYQLVKFFVAHEKPICRVLFITCLYLMSRNKLLFNHCIDIFAKLVSYIYLEFTFKCFIATLKWYPTSSDFQNNIERVVLYRGNFCNTFKSISILSMIKSDVALFKFIYPSPEWCTTDSLSAKSNLTIFGKHFSLIPVVDYFLYD